MVTEATNKIRQAREAAGLSREQLAVKAGISFNYVVMLEREQRRRPNVVIGQRLAIALGVTVAALWPPDMPADGRSA